MESKKKNKIMPSAAIRMDLEIIILSEVSQTEKVNLEPQYTLTVAHQQAR